MRALTTTLRDVGLVAESMKSRARDKEEFFMPERLGETGNINVGRWNGNNVYSIEQNSHCINHIYIYILLLKNIRFSLA